MIPPDIGQSDRRLLITRDVPASGEIVQRRSALDDHVIIPTVPAVKQKCPHWSCNPKTKVLAPHNPDCPNLAKIVAIEKSGICNQCGARKKRSLSWDAHMYCVVEQVSCPQGCSHSAVWKRPEHVSQKDRDELGLVKIKRRTKRR